MAIQLMLLAALFIAIANLCLRKSIDGGGTTKAYLMIQLFLSFFVMILLNPVRTGQFAWDTPIALFGIAGGFLLSGVMTFLGKAMEHGPPGLTVALLNCSSVIPILMLVIFFGSHFGFVYTIWNALGSVLVILGICWAGWGGKIGNRRLWTIFIALSFGAHVAYLVFLNWRALFINFPNEPGLGFAFAPEAASMQWFMPMVFLSASVIQTLLFFTQEKRLPLKSEVVYGVMGSLVNGLGAFFLIKATEVATPLEHAMIFPIFSVGVIVGCNLWGKWLYKEVVNWKANALCIGGILVGTIDWQSIFR